MRVSGLMRSCRGEMGWRERKGGGVMWECLVWTEGTEVVICV